MSDDTFMSGRDKAVLTGLAALTAAVIGILTSFNAVHWTTAETALVVSEAAAFWALMSALTAHLSRQTKQQPVAVAGTITALTTATVAVGIGFSWWNVSSTQNAYIVSLVTALIAVTSALVARTKVDAHMPGESGASPQVPAPTVDANGRTRATTNGRSNPARHMGP